MAHYQPIAAYLAKENNALTEALRHSDNRVSVLEAQTRALESNLENTENNFVRAVEHINNQDALLDEQARLIVNLRVRLRQAMGPRRLLPARLEQAAFTERRVRRRLNFDEARDDVIDLTVSTSDEETDSDQEFINILLE